MRSLHIPVWFSPTLLLEFFTGQLKLCAVVLAWQPTSQPTILHPSSALKFSPGFGWPGVLLFVFLLGSSMIQSCVLRVLPKIFLLFLFSSKSMLGGFFVSTCELFSSWMFSPAALLEFFPSKDNKCGFLHLMFFCHALELVLSFCVVMCSAVELAFEWLCCQVGSILWHLGITALENPSCLSRMFGPHSLHSLIGLLQRQLSHFTLQSQAWRSIGTAWITACGNSHGM